MIPAPSPLSPKNRIALTSALTWLSLAIVLLASAPQPSFAQDAGVSGIPSGPGNVNGTNGSVRDPSGIGNAGRVPSARQPDLNPVPVPNGGHLSSTRPSYTPRTRYARRWRHLPKHQRQKLERAAVKENDRLLGHGLTSICRGC
jgi:hypothetical protein